MFRKGQKVRQEFGTQPMEVIGHAPEFVENIITQWQDENGAVITAKFMESQLVAITENEN